MTETVTHTGFWLTLKQCTGSTNGCEFKGGATWWMHMQCIIASPGNRPVLTYWWCPLSVYNNQNHLLYRLSLLHRGQTPSLLLKSLTPTSSRGILSHIAHYQAHKVVKIPGPYFQLWHRTQASLSPRLWPLFEKSLSARGLGSKFIELWNECAGEPIQSFINHEQRKKKTGNPDKYYFTFLLRMGRLCNDWPLL